MGGWSSSGGGSGFTGTYGSGTITANTPITFTQTWNNGSVLFTGLKFNATDTASNFSSILLDLQIGGSSVYSFNRVGLAYTGDTLSFTSVNGATVGLHKNGYLTNSSTSVVGWSANSAVTITPDVALGRNAAGVLEVNNSTLGTYRDLTLRDMRSNPSASMTPAVNGELVVEKTSNTVLTFKLKGSDGTVRSATLTLA